MLIIAMSKAIEKHLWNIAFCHLHYVKRLTNFLFILEKWLHQVWNKGISVSLIPESNITKALNESDLKGTLAFPVEGITQVSASLYWETVKMVLHQAFPSILILPPVSWISPPLTSTETIMRKDFSNISGFF